MKLYRYIPAEDRKNEKKLYDDMLTNLKKARLYFVHPASFNDPLEAIIPYRFVEHGKIVEPKPDELKDVVAKLFTNEDLTSPRAERILEGLPLGVALENALMLSMSKAKNSQLMWAHYADNHKGICLEFDFPDNFLDRVRWSEQVKYHMEQFDLSSAFGEVKYGNSRPTLTFVDGIAQGNYNIMDALLSKPECWKYEKECRILLWYPCGGKCAFAAGIDTKECYFEYPKEWLTGITFGMRLSNDRCQEIANCVRKAGYTNVIWEKEKLINDKFEIASEQINI